MARRPAKRRKTEDCHVRNRYFWNGRGWNDSAAGRGQREGSGGS